jgi:uncharacterized protein (TIGR00730 family)
VFGSSQTVPGTVEWEDAEEVGRSLATAGVAVITGGYGGTMEAVSKGAVEASGIAIGVTAPRLFPGRSGANLYVSELIEAVTLTERIGTMVERSSAAIVLPGSIGTATELLVAWNLNHIARRNGGHGLPTVTVGPGWVKLVETMVGDLGAFRDDITSVSSVGEAIAWAVAHIEGD